MNSTINADISEYWDVLYIKGGTRKVSLYHNRIVGLSKSPSYDNEKK